MAIFGRRSARQRLRNAAREALEIPAFSAPVDCSSWVLGGLWPAELATVTPETALLADYLNADLQRIANSANEKLHALARSGLVGQERQAAEARVINVARAFAVLRVESTVRQLRKEVVEFGPEYIGLSPGQNRALPTEQTPAISVSTPAAVSDGSAAPPRPGVPPDPGASTVWQPQPARERIDPVLEPPLPAGPGVAESDEQRLHRLLAFVARQEPGLRWAVGHYADGSTRLVTDIASGWIPSGIELPADIGLLEPGSRVGTAVELLGAPTESAGYSPGDRLGRVSDVGATEVSVQPRALPMVEDLGWQLGEATHWRDGLPRMANTLVKARSAGTGVAESEIDLLRVHLDTMRYQLFAQYPEPDVGLLLNCMLLAAAEGFATGDTVSANYHYSWYLELSKPTAGQWDSQK